LILRLALVSVLLTGSTSVAYAQEPAGPTNLPLPPKVVRIPNRPQPDQAPMPPEEIIRRAGQTEAASSVALGGFLYKRTIRLEEFGPDGKASGSAESVVQMTQEADGSRRFRPVDRTESTLRSVELEPDTLEFLGKIPVFPFAAPQLPNYDITYQTAEPVDELMTYVFKVTPKQLSRTAAYFSGVIWIDNRDFAVVKTYGKWVTETGDLTPPNLPFTFFESYRQYVGDKYWMPAYSRSDGFVGSGDAQVPVRLVIRWEEYKPIAGTNAPAAAAPAGPSNAPTPAATPAAQAPADPNRPTLGPRTDR
jgi:hypothetical protein